MNDNFTGSFNLSNFNAFNMAEIFNKYKCLEQYVGQSILFPILI